MDILIGTLALNKIFKLYTGNDLHYIYRDVDYLCIDNSFEKSGVDYVKLNDGLTNKTLIELFGIENVTELIDNELVASPVLILSSYFERKYRFGYKLKSESDIFKLRILKSIFKERDWQQLNKLIELGIYKDDWSFQYFNEYLYRLNFINDELVIANQFALMFYFEQYLKRSYSYNSLDIEVYGEFETQNIVGSKVISIGNECEYNEFDLHKHFKIESLSSLISKTEDQDLMDELTKLKQDNNLN